jgi:hypothetical protein
LFDDLEYENILSTRKVKDAVQLSWSSGDRGIRTTKSVKRLGCTLLKSLIEDGKLHVEDFHIISELSTFVRKKNSYEADDGSNDDLVMCLVLFAWMTNQNFFSDLCKTDFKTQLYKDQLKNLEENMLSIQSTSSGNQMGDRFVEDGSVWDVVWSDFENR